jgi:hypothetical protein
VQSKENNGTNNDKNNYLDQMIIRNGIMSDLGEFILEIYPT